MASDLLRPPLAARLDACLPRWQNAWLLALDASCAQASLALYSPGRALIEKSVRAHASASEALVPALLEALGEQRLGAPQIGGIVVGTGPGSFTGLRVALSTAKGLALGLGCLLWGTNSLRLQAAAATPGTVWALRDARRQRYYVQCFSVDGDHNARALSPVRLCQSEALAQIIGAAPVVCDEPQALRAVWPDARVACPPVRAAFGLLAEAPRIEARLGDPLESLVPDYMQTSTLGG